MGMTTFKRWNHMIMSFQHGNNTVISFKNDDIKIIKSHNHQTNRECTHPFLGWWGWEWGTHGPTNHWWLFSNYSTWFGPFLGGIHSHLEPFPNADDEDGDVQCRYVDRTSFWTCYCNLSLMWGYAWDVDEHRYSKTWLGLQMFPADFTTGHGLVSLSRSSLYKRWDGVRSWAKLDEHIRCNIVAG